MFVFSNYRHRIAQRMAAGEKVRVSWANTAGNSGEVATYDFDYLCEYLHPFTREELRQLRADRRTARGQRIEQRQRLTVIDGNPSARRGFSNRQLAWHRLEDLRTLFRLRQGKVDGQSMPLLFWSLNFLLLSGVTCPARSFAIAANPSASSEDRFRVSMNLY